jgi:hypothetical protein
MANQLPLVHEAERFVVTRHFISVKIGKVKSKKQVKQSHYTPWTGLGGEEV